jgi:signal transduction histidine kinase
MMTRVFWLIRAAAYVVIGTLALISPPSSAAQRAIQIAAFSVVGAALVAWMLADVLPRYRGRALPVILAIMAAVAGLAATTSGGGQSLGAFAAVAAIAAGSDTELRTAIVVAVAGILPILIVGPLSGSTLSTMAGYPLLIAACLSGGRHRRSYRAQAEQAAALLQQYERVRAEQRRADVLDERTRIAREIHDVLAHSLGALGIQIQAAKAMLTDQQDVDRAVQTLTTAQRMAADGLTETRRAVHALRVDALPLDKELADVVAAHRQRYHVPVTFETSGTTKPLPPDAALALLRTAQEALFNAAKHAPGQQVDVRLDLGDGGARLSVVNPVNGAGAPAGRPGSTGGYGLTGMRERIRLLNGTLLAGPKENEWAVTAELPLAAAQDVIAG